MNPLFTGVSSFRPAGSGGELQLFQYAGIELVHGWLVDPSTPEYRVLSRIQDYDTCVTLIAEADHLSHGRFLLSEDEPSSSNAGPTHHRQSSLKPDEQQKIEDGKDSVVHRLRSLGFTLTTVHGDVNSIDYPLFSG